MPETTGIIQEFAGQRVAPPRLLREKSRHLRRVCAEGDYVGNAANAEAKPEPYPATIPLGGCIRQRDACGRQDSQWGEAAVDCLGLPAIGPVPIGRQGLEEGTAPRR